MSVTRNGYGARLFLVRKKAFVESGGFAGEPEIAAILEWEFLNRLQGSGGRVFAIPDAMAAVGESAPSPALDENQLARLAAPWTEAVPEPLLGVVRMALNPERKAGQAAGQPLPTSPPPAD